GDRVLSEQFGELHGAAVLRARELVHEPCRKLDRRVSPAARCLKAEGQAGDNRDGAAPIERDDMIGRGPLGPEGRVTVEELGVVAPKPDGARGDEELRGAGLVDGWAPALVEPLEQDAALVEIDGTPV